MKLDGYRAMGCKRGAQVSLTSRNRQDFTAQFAVVAEALAHLSMDAVMIDGEIVALDADGRPSFQQLQSFAMGEDRPPIYFYAFDLPWFEGRDLRALPIEDRKKKLASVLYERARQVHRELDVQP